jgi:hypothetical protein
MLSSFFFSSALKEAAEGATRFLGMPSKHRLGRHTKNLGGEKEK